MVFLIFQRRVVPVLNRWSKAQRNTKRTSNHSVANSDVVFMSQNILGCIKEIAVMTIEKTKLPELPTALTVVGVETSTHIVGVFTHPPMLASGWLGTPLVGEAR